ncbi:MAG TPA: cation transporter [Candidatus Limivicinus faecipullorum]|nr:cation transporter [Candidatus Limivicinus faecipullorum]
MINLLSKIFIKNRDKVNDPAVRRAYGTLCSVYGIFLNVLLFAGKYFAGAVSGSVAIVADAFNNLSDAGSSIISLLGFAIAGKKPDLDHPFGHGRAEYLAGMLLSALIVAMGVELGKSSIEKIIHPEPVEAGLLPAVILLASIAVKFYMSRYNKAVGRKISSPSMEATATDSLSDSIATTVVLLSMGVSYFFHVNVDGWAGLLVAAFIIFAGYNALRDTLSPLLGKAPDPELVKEIEETALAHPEIVGIHDLIIHDYGPGRGFVSLHAEVNGKGEIFRLHDAVDQAEREIREKFGILATIHMDPIDCDNEQLNELRQAVAEKLTEIDPRIKIHDFRMVPGPTHTNLIFDALVPAELKLSDRALEEQIENLVHNTWKKYFAVVDIDRSYV